MRPSYPHIAIGAALVLAVVGCRDSDGRNSPTDYELVAPVRYTEPIEVGSNRDEMTLATAHRLEIMGEIEMVRFPPHESIYDARIDTGAETSSVHADNVQTFSRDGEDWVAFDLIGREDQESMPYERPVSRTVLIRDGGSEPSKRYVVTLDVQLGDTIVEREFTLADRRGLDFAVFVGRNLLNGLALVDVSRCELLPTPVDKSSEPEHTTDDEAADAAEGSNARP